VDTGKCSLIFVSILRPYVMHNFPKLQLLFNFKHTFYSGADPNLFKRNICSMSNTKRVRWNIFYVLQNPWDWKPYTAAVGILSITHDKSKCTTCCTACSSLQKFYNSTLTSSHLYEHWSDCQNLCTNIINLKNSRTMIQDHCKSPNYVHKRNISLVPSDYTLP